MNLVNNNTKWILFLSTSNDPEERHILDLAFGLQCLESSGITQSDIFIYIDGKDRAIISQLIHSGSKYIHTIKETAYFDSDLSSNTHDNLVMFVSGHGGINGIDAQNVITPYALLSKLKKSPNLKHAVLYLGQCYAGTFNYMGAGRGRHGVSDNEPDIIIVGATNLHNSLSSPTQEILGSSAINWVANLFLLHIFKWISNPVDVDGDGKKTIIDSYKYAGVMSNNDNKNIKINSFVRSMDLHDKWEKAKQDHETNPSLTTKLNFDAINTIYASELSIRYTHQECWILNAIPAQSIEY